MNYIFKILFLILFSRLLSSISLLIALTNSFLLLFFKTKLLLNVSDKPPLFDVMTAHPLDALSKAVRPNGSSHLGLLLISMISHKSLVNFYDLSNYLFLNEDE